MKQNEIDTLLESFFISESELHSRSSFHEFANSMASIVVDEFTQKYLLNNPSLSIYLAHTDANMLLKKLKNFFSYVLTAPVNEEYVHTIHSIGYVHYTVKLEPAKVSYGFWAIAEVITKLAQTNPIINEHRAFILKLFRFVEHVMNQGFYMQEKKESQEQRETTPYFNSVQNELFNGLKLHKANTKKIQSVINDRSQLEILEEISEDSSLCTFGKTFGKIASSKNSDQVLGISFEKVFSLHDEWHEEFVKIKHSLQNNDETLVAQGNAKILAITSELTKILESSIQESLLEGQLSLQSTLRSVKKITKLFHNKEHVPHQNSSVEELIKLTLDEVVGSDFLWAIEKVEVTREPLRHNEENTIVKALRYKSYNFYISISLKETKDSVYLHEMFYLLLEVLELHFFVQERELSLIKFANEAENANKAKDMFLANMSHELRTPINAITGFSQILMMKKDTPQSVKSYVEKINIAGNNLLNLVNTILDFAKLESGKMQFNPSLSNISNVIRETQTLVTPLAQKKNIKLIMPNIVSLNLYIDNTLFKQVLINLLSNAIKFTHENGEVVLSISYSQENHTYRFAVKDNGIGLTEEEVKKLFQAFSQVENAYQKEHKGTGLGLMISKNIIEELHKGKIWVESQKGVGSTFFIEMPTPMIESNTYEVNQAASGSPHVLIVEDSEEYQKILVDNLENKYRVTVTDTINKAKQLIMKNTYDYLILDFFLTDGISSEILQYMEEENISIPSIVISAEDEIHISSSLAGTSNLECILNKKNIVSICSILSGEEFKDE